MNDYFLVMYNSLNEVENDFDNLFQPNDNYLKQVLDKWMLLNEKQKTAILAQMEAYLEK